MPKKSNAELITKFPVNINEVYPNYFRTRNAAIRYLVRNFTNDIDFMSFSKKRCIKHSPQCNFLLTEKCSKELMRIGGAL